MHRKCKLNMLRQKAGIHTSLELRVSDMERKSLLSGILSFELDSFIELPNAKRRGGLSSDGRDGGSDHIEKRKLQ